MAGPVGAKGRALERHPFASKASSMLSQLKRKIISPHSEKKEKWKY